MAQKEKTLVVLLGWMAGHPKHVQKYADWWGSYDCDVISSCATPVTTFYPPAAKKLALGLVRQIKEYVDKNPNCSIVFHAFSNGGGFPLSQIHQVLAQKEYTYIREKIRGNVCDSMLDVFPMSAMRAFQALKLPFFVNIFFYIIFPIIMILAKLTNFYTNMLGGYLKNKYPTHVIYSNGDVICKPEEIEYFIEQLRSNGITVTSTKFKDSVHVGHFRKYPEEYALAITKFLANNNVKLEKSTK